MRAASAISPDAGSAEIGLRITKQPGPTKDVRRKQTVEETMASGNSRTVLLIGTAMVATGLMEGAAFGQATAPPPPQPLYPGPAAPTCIVKAPTDCRLPDGHPDLTGLYVAGGNGGLASGNTSVVFAG